MRAGKMAMHVDRVSLAVLVHREGLASDAIAAGHAVGDLSWEHRRAGVLERWDLVHRDGRWLGGVCMEIEPTALVVRAADSPPER